MEVPEQLKEILQPITDLSNAVDQGNAALKASGAMIQNLSRMLDVAMIEMISLAQDSLTPLPIRARLVKKLTTIRAIGLP